MCACEPGYLCPRCAGTPDDPGYVDDDPRERELAAARAWEQRTLAAELDVGHIGGAP